MIVHELTTKPVKYGALSNMSGYVKVSWSTKQNGKDAEPVLQVVQS
jgi:two-component sensor histidine kinase